MPIGATIENARIAPAPDALKTNAMIAPTASTAYRITVAGRVRSPARASPSIAVASTSSTATTVIIVSTTPRALSANESDQAGSMATATATAIRLRRRLVDWVLASGTALVSVMRESPRYRRAAWGS